MLSDLIVYKLEVFAPINLKSPKETEVQNLKSIKFVLDKLAFFNPVLEPQAANISLLKTVV